MSAVCDNIPDFYDSTTENGVSVPIVPTPVLFVAICGACHVSFHLFGVNSVPSLSFILPFVLSCPFLKTNLFHHFLILCPLPLFYTLCIILSSSPCPSLFLTRVFQFCIIISSSHFSLNDWASVQIFFFSCFHHINHVSLNQYFYCHTDMLFLRHKYTVFWDSSQFLFLFCLL